MPSAVKTASKAVVNRQSRSRSKTVIALARSGEIHQQVAGGLSGPRTGRMRRHSDQMCPAGAMFDRDQCVDPFE